VSPADNSAVATTVVNPRPDLSVSMTSSLNRVKVNSPIMSTIKVKNRAGLATDARLTVNLPDGMEFVSMTPGDGVSRPDLRTVRVQLGRLDPGAERTLSLKLMPRVAGDLVTTAFVACAEPGRRPGQQHGDADHQGRPGDRADQERLFRPGAARSDGPLDPRGECQHRAGAGEPEPAARHP
jgi:hypothetical protein